MGSRTVLRCCVLVGVCVATCIADTIYVDGTNGNDAWNGLCETWDGGTCGPKLTIQAGIDAALTGDNVRVADGTYTGQLNHTLRFYGKGIQLVSATGAVNCIIDAESSAPCFMLTAGEPSTARVDGFTIRRGRTQLSGAIRCWNSSPVIANCIIEDSYAINGGGGVHCDGGSPRIENCLIRNNAGGGGGGIQCGGENVTIIGCTIVGNWAGNFGGAVAAGAGSCQITNCTIAGNTGYGIYISGGASTITGSTVTDNTRAGLRIQNWSDTTVTGCEFARNAAGISALATTLRVADCYIHDHEATSGGLALGTSGGDVLVERCIFQHNRTSAGTPPTGATVYCYAGSPIFKQCLWVANEAADGALACWPGTQPRLDRCLFIANTASELGGALTLYDSELTAIHCVFAHNAALDASAIWCHGAGRLTLHGCTLWGGTADPGDHALLIETGSAARFANCIIWPENPVSIGGDLTNVEVRYSDVRGGFAGVGNIDADPLLADPAGQDGDPLAWADNDYRLAAGSPCIDAGDNLDPPRDTLDADADGCETDPLPIDLGGLARFVDDAATPDTGRGLAPIIDIGAYEFGAVAPPIPGGPCAGDVNCDGTVGFNDINPFVLLLSNPAAWAGAYPHCPVLNGDTNNDGTVSFGDINPFVSLLTQL